MLKSLLSLLLSLFYSKSESAKVASQSLPNELDFTSVTLNTSQPDTFAAPYDGYLCIVVDTGGSINVWGDGLQSSNYSLNNGQSKLFVPMRKGNIIGYSISGRLLFGKFYRLVGGGYSAIEKLIRSGGALCLSNLYNSLRRSSWLARRSGWLISRLIFLRPLQKLPSLLTENATPSQCLTRASWFCNVTASCLQDLTDLTWSISEREQTATSAFLFIPRKATLFLTRLANPTTSEPQTCTSIRLTVANNLSIGGVSC